MQFNGCSVVIYQGNAAPPVFPPPGPFQHREFDDLDLDSLYDLRSSL